MNVDLDPVEARRLSMLLAGDVARDAVMAVGPLAEMVAENRVTLRKLQPACRWDDADPIARQLAAGSLTAAGLA